MLECLEKFIDENPLFSRESVARVRSVLVHEMDNPRGKIPYRFLTHLEDYKLYYLLHPEWVGKPTSEMQTIVKGEKVFIRPLRDGAIS